MLTWRALAQAEGDLIEYFELGFAFDIEAADARLQRSEHLSTGLAHAGGK